VVDVTGQNFTANGTLRSLTIGGASALQTLQPAIGADGIFRVRFTLPQLNPGTYDVVATDSGGKTARATFTVTAPPPASGAASIDLINCTGRLTSRNLAGSNNTWQFEVTANGTASGPVGTEVRVINFTQYVHAASTTTFTRTFSWQSSGGVSTRSTTDSSTNNWSIRLVFQSLYVTGETERVDITVIYRLPRENAVEVKRSVTCTAS
jgi:hypothetical protein